MILRGVAIVIMTAAAVTAAEPYTPHPYESGRPLIERPDEGFTLRAPPDRTFCHPHPDDMFSSYGFFVPLVPTRCETHVYPQAPAGVHIRTVRPYSDDIEPWTWDEFSENCRPGGEIARAEFQEAGTIAGFPARRCKQWFATEYGHTVLIRRGPIDDRAAYFWFIAYGRPEDAGALDRFLDDVLRRLRLVTPRVPVHQQP
jgi:hypothetical protein